MANKTQNTLFNFIIFNSNIDDIQSRFISYKLELEQVKNITVIEQKNTHNYIFKTDNGFFKVKTVDIPLPISTVTKK